MAASGSVAAFTRRTSLRVKVPTILYYNAKDSTELPWVEESGVVMSKDLVHWTRFAGNPILKIGGAGSFDQLFASNPCVVKKGHAWCLYYFGLSQDGKARTLAALGDDPTHFTKSDEVVIDVGPQGSIDDKHAHKSSVIWWKGDLYHFYGAVQIIDGKEERGISVARSRPW